MNRFVYVIILQDVYEEKDENGCDMKGVPKILEIRNDIETSRAFVLNYLLNGENKSLLEYHEIERSQFQFSQNQDWCFEKSKVVKFIVRIEKWPIHWLFYLE